MAFSPQTGQIILQAAQGLSQVLNLQAQMAQRQQQFEAQQKLEVDALRQKNEIDRLRAEREKEEQKLKLAQLELEGRRVAVSERRVELAEEEVEISRQVGPAGERLTDLTRRLGFGRGLVLNVNNELPQKAEQWGFKPDVTLSDAIHPNGSFKANITQAWQENRFQFDPESLEREARSVDSQIRNLLDNTTTREQLKRRDPATLKVYEQLLTRQAAVRAGQAAVGDVTSRKSPLTLISEGLAADPATRNLSASLKRQQLRAADYFQSINFTGDGQQLIQDDIGSQNVSSIARHVKLHIAPRISETTLSSVSFVNFKSYVREILGPTEGQKFLVKVIQAVNAPVQ